MWKLIKSVICLLLVIGVAYAITLVRDMNTLHDQIIRLHVVADTDDPIDQEIKLLVRDEVLQFIETIKDNATTKEDALLQLQEQLPSIEQVANGVLEKMGQCYHAVVSLQQEAFPTRSYDTFSLPAGVYDSLRITIGSGEGQNWWCVVFPDLCTSAASVSVEDTALEAGFSGPLSNTLTLQEGYEVRFWILDCFGKLQNIFFGC